MILHFRLRLDLNVQIYRDFRPDTQLNGLETYCVSLQLANTYPTELFGTLNFDV